MKNRFAEEPNLPKAICYFRFEKRCEQFLTIVFQFSCETVRARSLQELELTLPLVSSDTPVMLRS